MLESDNRTRHREIESAGDVWYVIRFLRDHSNERQVKNTKLRRMLVASARILKVVIRAAVVRDFSSCFLMVISPKAASSVA